MVFEDRADAGRLLGEALKPLARTRPVVLGIPRGGVELAVEVARALGVAPGVIIARKIGAPGHEELAIGAVAEGGARVKDAALCDMLGVDDFEFERRAAHAAGEVLRRAHLFRRGGEAEPIRDRTVIVVDDGLATGATMEAAVESLRDGGAARIVVAVPVGARETVERLSAKADDVVCLSAPADFGAVGRFYRSFPQLEDDEVLALLGAGGAPADPPETADGTRELDDVGSPGVAATLTAPRDATGVVVFAHGSGSGRHSPRNRAVAAELNRHGIATLLLDLLTPEEQEVDELGGAYRFDIGLLTRRLIAAIDWLGADPRLGGLPVGAYGASTGAAAALGAAARRSHRVKAVVSRGGRVDLVAPAEIRKVRAPVLLIVGSLDPEVLALNRETFTLLRGEKELRVVDGAGHLFEEPGAMAQVASATVRWFDECFSAPADRVEPPRA